MIGTMMKLFSPSTFVIVCAVSLASCASMPSETATPLETCQDLIRRVDQRVADRHMTDAEAARVEGFPYLRTNRFLASFRAELVAQPNSAPVWEDWIERMRALDRTAREIELRNLGAANIEDTVEACATSMLDADLEDPNFAARVAEKVRVPTHYDDGVRALGLYPLTQLGVALGFENWKAENLPSFKLDPEIWQASEQRYSVDKPADMTLITQQDVAALIDLASNNALGIPDLEGSVLESIARLYAPVFAVESNSGADQIGKPVWDEAGQPTTDPQDPLLYIRLSHTRFDGEVLPQLVYSIWFPARPRTGPLDILGGAMDGLYWRVTLDRKGEPLIYDTFHACGCYHLFFPAEEVRRVHVAEDDDLREEPLVPIVAPVLKTGERLVVHVAGTSHYVRGLSTTAEDGHAISLRPVDEMEGPSYGLRSVESGGGQYKSIYEPDGLMAGTARLERFLLWPMGISSPGAMRQWGTHATAFVGERHADDPFLFEQAFER